MANCTYSFTANRLEIELPMWEGSNVNTSVPSLYDLPTGGIERVLTLGAAVERRIFIPYVTSVLFLTCI